MSVIRVFIAVRLSPEIQLKLGSISAQLKKQIKGSIVRWVPVNNIHITLKFLGDVSIANLELLKKIIQSEAFHYENFKLSVGELGVFPSQNRPRVIWVGVRAPEELAFLQKGIETETERLGYKVEERPFSPHLTLGRVNRTATSEDVRGLGEILGSVNVGYLGEMAVDQVHIYKSDLQPGGSVYTCLFSAPLRTHEF